MSHHRTTAEHYLTRESFPGTGGDRPTPWEVTYLCGGCGIELYTEEQGRSGPDGTPEDALQAHIEEEELGDLRHCDLPCCNIENEGTAA